MILQNIPPENINWELSINSRILPFERISMDNASGLWNVYTIKIDNGLSKKIELVTKESDNLLSIFLANALLVSIKRDDSYKDAIWVEFHNLNSEGSFEKRFQLDTRNTSLKSLLNEFNKGILMTGEEVVNNRDAAFPADVLILQGDLSKYAGINNHSLRISYHKRSGCLYLSIAYNTSKYSRDTIIHTFGNISYVIDTLLVNANVLIGDVLAKAESEIQFSTLDAAAITLSSPSELTLPTLFEATVQNYPHSTALTFENERVSYATLNNRVNQLAYFLRNNGVGRESIVGLLFTPSIDMVVTLLAVLKAGGAYLPIDSQLPVERIKYILSDSNVSVLISGIEDKQFLIEIDDIPSKKVFQIKDIWREVVLMPTENLPALNYETDLAYVIYTSGSTGKPKGVLIEHINVVSLIRNSLSIFDFSSSDCWTLFHSYNFDFSVWEMFGCLFTGGRLVIVPGEVKKDSVRFINMLEKERVTVLNQTPSAFNNLLWLEGRMPGSNLCIRYVIFGGEKLSPSLLKSWKDRYPECKLINMYGITEITVHATYKEITHAEIEQNSETVGLPLPMLKFYVLDSYQKVIPKGFYGELYIAGTGVARGYLNAPDLTCARFICDGSSDEILYKTGDIVLVNSNNELEYIERADEQVKVRGYRIDLNEIEYWCLKFDKVVSVFSRAIELANYNKHIVTYIQTSGTVDNEKLRVFLEEKLPAYMIPAYIVQVDSVPLTNNGKIDYKQLHNPFEANEAVNSSSVDFNEELVGIWVEVLKISKNAINSTSNFFKVGGDSLSAVILATEIERKYKIAFPVSVLFDCQTIDKVSSYINNEIKDRPGVKEEKCLQKVRHKNVYSLSPTQKGIFFLHKLFPDSLAYNVTSFFTLEIGNPLEDVKEAFSKLIDRHEILRTSIVEIEGEPYQKIHDYINPEIEIHEHSDPGKVTEAIQSFTQPFDLSIPGIFRAIIIKDSTKGRYIIGIDVHHIITDYITNNILLNDLLSILRHERLSELSLQYKDYAEYCNSTEYNDNKELQKKYWIDKLYDIETKLLDLPVDFKNADNVSAGRIIKFELPQKSIYDFVNSNEGSTVHGFFLSVFTLLLHYVTGQKNVIVGIPYYGRKYKETLNIAGPFINTLPILTNIDPDSLFIDYNAAVQKEILKAIDNSDVSFMEMVNLIAPTRHHSPHPIFNVLFDYTDKGRSSKNDDEYREYIGCKNITTQYDLVFYVSERDHSFYIECRYALELFKNEKIEHWLSIYKSILFDALSDPLKKVSQLNFLPGHQQTSILENSRGVLDETLLSGNIIEMFEHIAGTNPDIVAITANDVSYMYGQINALSNAVARYLMSNKVVQGDLVAILLERNIDTIIAILAVLKAGAAYVPLDTKHPESRILNILRDSNVKTVITERTNNLWTKIPEVYTVLTTNEFYSLPGDENYTKNIKLKRDASDPIYVIYTSGTTGNPKGVLVTQIGILNRLNWMQKQFPLKGRDVVLFKTPYTFDVSVWEILWWAITGNQLCILPDGHEGNPEQIINALEKHKVSVMHFVPSMLNLFIDYLNQNKEEILRLSSLRSVFASGEQLKRDTVNRFYKLFNFETTKLYNLYGPTEACIDVTYYCCIPESIDINVPIGKPIDNVNVYVRNSNGLLADKGIEGEIYIGGKGLAAGYINSPELTSEKFVQDMERKEMLYKTGDIGYWNENNEIVYVGRIDHQVKIRGYRIELHEVENAIKQYKIVKDVVVIATADVDKEMSLIALIVLMPGSGSLDITDLKSYLSELLPMYALPSIFLTIDAIPLTRNGKVDKNTLNNIAKVELSKDILHNTNKTDRNINTNTGKLTAIWKDILGHERFGVHDDFFSVGGDSLKMLRLIYKVKDAYKIKLDLHDVFNNATIEKISQIISEGHIDVSIPIVPGTNGVDRIFELSPMQKRIWKASMQNSSPAAYNIIQAISIDGSLNMEAFQYAVNELIARHEMLRVKIILEDGEIYQEILPPDSFFFKLDTIEMPETGNGEIDLKTEEIVNHEFDLLSPPLFKITLFRHSDTKHQLLLCIHHIISDGWSLNIIFRDFLLLYEAYGENRRAALPQINVRYADFIKWQQKLSKPAVDYWAKVLQKEIIPVTLSKDYSGGTISGYTGESSLLSIDDDTKQLMMEFCRKMRITNYMLVVAVLNILLHKYTKRQDIVIGSFVAGRESQSLENLVGCFINTILLRNDVDPKLDCLSFIKNVRNNCLNALKYQQCSYEEVVKSCIWRKEHKQQLFRIAINMANFNVITNSHELRVLKITPKDLNFRSSKFDLTLHTNENGTINFEYNTSMYKESTIQKFQQRFLYLIKTICRNPNQMIKNMEVHVAQKLPPLIDIKDKS